MKKEFAIEKMLEKKITTKGDLDRNYITAYVVKNGSDDDKIWLAELFRENAIKRTNNVRGGEYVSVNLKVIREAFCLRFPLFYDFSDKAKREARKNDDIFNAFLNGFDIELSA